MKIRSLPGFREFEPDRLRERRRVFQVLRDSARRAGFEEYDGPVLEPLELYLEKSGEEILNQVFWFEDKGGRRVALRPEMTPTLARMVGASANSLRRPVKWYSLGEQYRFERPQKGRQRAFYQFNVDLLGEESESGDAEVISVFADALTHLGLTAEDVLIRLSDRRLWLSFLAAEKVPETAFSAVLSVVDRIDKQPAEKSLDAFGQLVGGQAEYLLGRIREFRSLSSIEEIAAFIGPSVPPAILASWNKLLADLEALGAGPFVKVDLGIVRGLAYYTGFVFEVFEASGQGRAIAGGGRYDELVGKLGGPSMPAVGGAMGDVTLMDLLEEKGLLRPSMALVDCFVIYGEAHRYEALRWVSLLRQAGYVTEYVLSSAGFGKQFKEASRRGARVAVTLGDDEVKQGTLKVKDLTSGEESEIPAAHLLGQVQGLFGGRE